MDVCNCAGLASLGFPSSAGSVHSVPLRLVLVLMLLNVKKARDAGGSEQCFSSHRRTVQSQDVCVLEDYQHLTDWEEGRACEMFFSSWCLYLEKEVRFGSLMYASRKSK